MKSRKIKKISDDMIGIDERICSCSSIVGDIIVHAENKKGKNSLKKIAMVLTKRQKTSYKRRK
jgi:16S rRNA G1207 methylase RsmC